MGQDLIRYDILTQDALRGVIRKVLSEVSKTGLPGDHHFFITFLTGAPGVRVSARLREKYPEVMTIVIQHQYWDLKVNENGFEVGLSFSDVPERLMVPFSAIRGFYDPAVNFELEFDLRDVEAANTSVGDGSEELETVEELTPPPASKEKAPQDADPSAEQKGSADVVSLDAFRKKS
ncbi:SspB family protein [Consotaella salsifontis]|uniref:Stringent starvation protein B n=1 Tax=Consotaella salsifontis TaxID=1365950 RepID=A0A1T4RCR8_9HYPH|nr:SspB family protein [Consotaella salsifontis]SKA13441.1 hypothetical protein SAMN05428963_106192 [Consotaella salsifontis]